jgi:hypothetical protein
LSVDAIPSSAVGLVRISVDGQPDIADANGSSQGERLDYFDLLTLKEAKTLRSRLGDAIGKVEAKEPKPKKTWQDYDGLELQCDDTEGDSLTVELDTSGGVSITNKDGRSYANVYLEPKKARKLAKALKVLAAHIESELE